MFVSFLELLTTIVIIESEGITIDGKKMWVKSYQVTTSNDSQSWTGYPEENAIEVIITPSPLTVTRCILR